MNQSRHAEGVPTIGIGALLDVESLYDRFLPISDPRQRRGRPCALALILVVAMFLA